MTRTHATNQNRFFSLLLAVSFGLGLSSGCAGPDDPVVEDGSDGTQELPTTSDDGVDNSRTLCRPACDVLLGTCDPEIVEDPENIAVCRDLCLEGIYTDAEIACLAATPCGDQLTCFDGDA